MGKFFFTLVLFFSSVAWSYDFSKSARREPGEDFSKYVQFSRLMTEGPETSGSAYNSAMPYDPGRLPEVAKWPSKQMMQEQFERIRDRRWIVGRQNQDFLRRITWMYPDDGCYARASLMNKLLMEQGHQPGNKIFVFGNLGVESPNAIHGFVTWWYHVAPIVEVEGKKYVLDPAIEPKRPLTADEWLSRMSESTGDLLVAVCGSGTYHPGDSCNRVSDGVEEDAYYEQLPFLGHEWFRLVDLNRDPERELGEHPPWL